MVVRVAFLKLGFLGVTSLIEALLDERANRKDVSIRVISSGVNLKEDQAESAAKLLLKEEHDLIVVVAPNATTGGPATTWKKLSDNKRTVIVVSDSPAKKGLAELDSRGVGYLIIEADSMLGARREFLDPVEMALFNSDIIRVLAVSGVYRQVHSELDRVIGEIRKGKKPRLPKLVVGKDVVTSHGGFSNPYAQAKAIGSFEIARLVGEISTEGMYRIQERERYLPVLAAAHEMMRHAALLADEAREVEKGGDRIARQVHLDDGTLAGKTGLMEKIENQL